VSLHNVKIGIYTSFTCAHLRALQDLANIAKWREKNEKESPALHCLPDFHTKIRPGVSHFLKALAPLYRLYIYTMGDEVYACAMASLLDAEGNLFRNRVINRADANWAQQQKGLDKLGVVPSMAAVVDDTVGTSLLCVLQIQASVDLEIYDLPLLDCD
jgi:TFIIF-interacting CTD phosphatase-like protein